MSVSLSLLAGSGWQFFDNSGNVLTGGLLYTYVAGTTTPAATYTSVTGLTANSNPIVLDAAGRVSTQIWLTDGAGYKFRLESSTGTQIGSWDNITSQNTGSTSLSASAINYTAAGSTTVRTLQAKSQESVSVKDFGAVGDGVTNDAAAIQAAINYVISSPFARLYVPAGSYYVASSLVVSGASADRFTMYGDGRASDIWSNQAISTLDIAGQTANTFQYPMLQDLAIRNTNAAGTALRTRNTEFFRMLRCTISGSLNGLIMSENAGESDIKPQIHECVFANSANGLKGGDTRVADAVIRDNLFIDCTTTMMDFGYLDGGTISGNKMFSNNGASNAVIGLRLKKPIYVVVQDNAFFQLGGTALQLTSPRYSRFVNNQITDVGKNAAATAITVTDFSAAVAGVDVQFIGNTLKDCDGSGISVSSTNSVQSNFKIQDNYFENVGDSGVAYDAILLTNCTNFEVRKNTITGGNFTRYWLNVSGSSLVMDDNIHVNCINPDVFRTGTNTLRIPMGQRFLTNVTTTQTLTFDDDGVIGGTITGASITMNLPAANACPGKRFMIAKTDSSIYSLIIDPASTQTIDGASTLNVNTQYQVVNIISDGISNWVTISS